MLKLHSFILVFLFILPVPFNALAERSPGFVTSASCKNCHVTQYDSWYDSHHHWAWNEPSKKTVLGNFDNASYEHNGFTYRFTTKDDKYFIVADGPDGKATTYQVIYTDGVTPLQQYLVKTGKGRLQALDVTWDTERKRWYHLYPGQDTSASNGMHWSGSYKNWNARCAECHATDYHKNYNPLKDSYSSTQSEIGVGCEACHGPGEAHITWAKKPGAFKPSQWSKVNSLGLKPTHNKNDAASEINLCAGCHSRREQLGSSSPPVGSDFDDHYRVSLLRNGLYHPDGQIQEEVYVYGSFLQSKMHARGVKCSNCHDAHSYKLKLQGNALCTQCHNPGGNPLFPTLTKADYDSPAHHFHPKNSKGADCKNCHMPQQLYMVVDGRRDHSFRIPRPDLAAKLNTTDPCVQCHTDKTSDWASNELKTRFPAGYTGKPHFAETFARARQSLDDKTRSALLLLAQDKQLPAIVRASALDHMAVFPRQEPLDKLQALVADASPLVRAATADVVRRQSTPETIKLLYPLLADSKKSVRLQAAKTFLGADEQSIPAAYRMHLGKAMKELQRSLHAKADFPEAQMMLGGIALTLRSLPAATSAFERAVAMDPQLVHAWIMLARIHAAQGNQGDVRDVLNRATTHNPDNPEIQQALGEIGDLPGK